MRDFKDIVETLDYCEQLTTSVSYQKLNSNDIDYLKEMVIRINNLTSVQREYIPGSGMTSMSSSRRSPNLRSEIDSIQFDLGEDDHIVSTDKKVSRKS